MTQREKPQSMGVLILVVFSAALLWAVASLVWSVPVIYADDPEVLTITVTSSRGTYFYDPGLDPTGGTVYFNSVGGEGAGQVLTVTVTCSGTVGTFEGAPAFGDNPPPDVSAPWQVTYTVEAGAGTQSGIIFTVTNTITETDTAVITFTRDNVDPTVVITDVTNPGYDNDPDRIPPEPLDELDTDGSNWYNTDDFTEDGGDCWEFTSDTVDDGAGLSSGFAFWDHSANQADRTLLCGPGGDNTFFSVSNDADGTITVTVTITDHVGNSANDRVVFNIDNTGPTITSPSISESSPYLHADGLTLYYGDKMGPVQDFYVNGSSNDTGVGLYLALFSGAFGATPISDTTPGTWSGRYCPDNQDWGDGIITVTVTDRLDNAAYQIFEYFRDTKPPAVGVICPGFTSVPSWTVSWSVEPDLPPTSGLDHYDVQYSKVGSAGPWENWHTNPPLTQDTFGPTSPVIVEDDHTYYFQVQATDNVSNIQHSAVCSTTYQSGIKEVFLPIVMKGQCGPDNYEPNDWCWQAYGPLTSGQTYQSWISGCDRATYKKSDYFYIDISTTRTIKIYLTNIPAGTDYDLYLYRYTDDDPLKPVAYSKDTGSSETISYNPTATGRYYIRVYSYRGSSTSLYSLRVTYE